VSIDLGSFTVGPIYLAALLIGSSAAVLAALLPAKSVDRAVVRGLLAFGLTVPAVCILWRLL